jgi:hypothetical protein
MKRTLGIVTALTTLASLAGYLALREPPKKGDTREPEPSARTEAQRPSFERSAPSNTDRPVVFAAATEEAVEPHPLTPERAVQAARNDVLGAMEKHLSAGRLDQARELLREHDSRFGDLDGWREDREAFEAIFDCLEHPGPESRARGARFVDDYRASPHRRKVRHACLGRRQPLLLE